jgi:hypothetical protein
MAVTEGHFKMNLGNVAAIAVVAILAVGITVWILRWLASMQITGISHLALGGLAFLK